MTIYVNQEEYKIVFKKDSIGSFGAGPCTILMLYDEQTKLCSHLDALTDEVIFNFEIRKFLIRKDKSKIDIILTSSGLDDNFTLRTRILRYLRNLGLDKKEIIVEGTEMVLNSKNEIETDFEPKQKFDLSNMDKSLEKELLEKAFKLKILVEKFALSRKHLPNVDEFGRQPEINIHMRYNYSTASWVYHPPSKYHKNTQLKFDIQKKDFKSFDNKLITNHSTTQKKEKREITKRQFSFRQQKYIRKPVISQMKSHRFKDIQRHRIGR
jgi:hypothetical protein